MKLRVIVVLLAGALILAWGLGGFAQEEKEGEKKEEKKEPQAEYVGAKKCKFCHKAEYESWLETQHAHALETLKPEDQKKDSCIVCHVTGFGVADTIFAGVQCEACHGPGSLYKSMKIMHPKKYKENPEKQHQLALEAGLILPTEETCRGCHNEKSPTFKGFDFDSMFVAGVHDLPEEEEPTEEKEEQEDEEK